MASSLVINHLITSKYEEQSQNHVPYYIKLAKHKNAKFGAYK